MVGWGRPQMTIRRMRIACWIPKATNTHSEHVILIEFPLQQWLNERASTLRNTHFAWLFLCALNIGDTAAVFSARYSARSANCRCCITVQCHLVRSFDVYLRVFEGT
jgi:hypothetical protein